MTSEKRKTVDGDAIKQFVVPTELWERMKQAVFRIACGREVHAGDACYDPGLCCKKAVDKLIDDIRANERHNAESEG